MNEIILAAGVQGYLDTRGAAWLNAEDVARGFGFTQEKNGVEYVKWERVNAYLQSFGFSPRVGKDDYIPENMVYRLGFKANNDTAVRFQSILADEVLPSIRKTGAYFSPSHSASNPKIMEIEAQFYLADMLSHRLRLNDASKLGIYQAIAEPYNIPVPQYVQSKGVMKSAQALLKEIGSGMSAQKFNILLVREGYLEEMSRPAKNGTVKKFKSITEKGLPYGENVVSPKNQNETQPHWYADKFRELYDTIIKDN